MMLINCPFCGPRAESEFECGGQAHIVRPEPAEEVSAEVWANYLFMRENPKGLHYERWCHSHGCGRWFNVARDTTSHEIRAIYKMHESRPHGSQS